MIPRKVTRCVWTETKDKGLESYKSWYDPTRSFIDHSHLALQGNQFDPNNATDRIVQVIERDTGKFRNLLPAQFMDVARKLQAAA